MPFLLLLTLLLLLLFWPYWYLYWQWCTWRQSVVNNACLPLLTTVTLARINDEHSLHFCLSGRCTDIPDIRSLHWYPLQWHCVNRVLLGFIWWIFYISLAMAWCQLVLVFCVLSDESLMSTVFFLLSVRPQWYILCHGVALCCAKDIP